MDDITDLEDHPWFQLYELYLGVKCSPCEDYRQFRAWVGVVPVVAEYVFVKYQHPIRMPTRTSLLVVLHFLKVMPTEDNARALFKYGSRNTYRKVLWSTLQYLHETMTEV